MKETIPVLLVFSLVGCTSIPEEVYEKSVVKANEGAIKIYENKFKGIDSIIDNRALEAFKSKYQEASLHRAFAQSTSGAWNWRSNKTSIEHAKTSALIACQRNNRSSEDLYPCRVIHIDDDWVK